MKAQLKTVEQVLEEADNATLSSAMALAFAEIEAATKGAENGAFKQNGKVSKYADINSVIGAIKPALISHGLFFTQRCHPSPDGVSVETVLGHISGQELSLGTLYVPANKRDPHGFGSALTYARRYALVTAFGVPVEDDDGNKGTEGVNGAISEDQWQRLEQNAEKAGADKRRLASYLGVSDLKHLPVNKLPDANAAIAKKAGERAKELEPVT